MSRINMTTAPDRTRAQLSTRIGEAGRNLRAAAYFASHHLAPVEESRTGSHRPHHHCDAAGHLQLEGSAQRAVWPGRGDRRRMFRGPGRGDLSAIGAAAGHYLETTLRDGEVIGISSWSASLLRMVDNIHPLKRIRAERVVQILGGIGGPSVQSHATDLTTRLAGLTGAEAAIAPRPRRREFLGGAPRHARWRLCARHHGPVPSCHDRSCRRRRAATLGDARQFRQHLHQRRIARSRGARTIGDVCLRFFDREGKPVADRSTTA